MKQTKKQTHWLHPNVVRIAKLHFVYAALFLGQSIIFDAWKLIAPKALLNRWIACAVLVVVTTIVWYLAKSSKTAGLRTYQGLLFALILTDIALATFNIYTQRGMASRAVAEYALPIIVSAALLSRAAIYATATLCAVAYTSASIAYFVLNFNEGYKIELYGEVGFYTLMFFVLAGILWNIVHIKKQAKT